MHSKRSGVGCIQLKTFRVMACAPPSPFFSLHALSLLPCTLPLESGHFSARTSPKLSLLLPSLGTYAGQVAVDPCQLLLLLR
jgi:hypothetical protein